MRERDSWNCFWEKKKKNGIIKKNFSRTNVPLTLYVSLILHRLHLSSLFALLFVDSLFFLHVSLYSACKGIEIIYLIQRVQPQPNRYIYVEQLDILYD